MIDSFILLILLDLPSLSIVRGYEWCLYNIGNVYIISTEWIELIKGIDVMNVTTLDLGPYAFTTLRYRYIVSMNHLIILSFYRCYKIP